MYKEKIYKLKFINELNLEYTDNRFEMLQQLYFDMYQYYIKYSLVLI